MLAVALAALGGAFVLFVLMPRALLAGMREALEQRVKRRYPEPSAIVRADFTASSFGVQSLGLGQWRGNGALVLTDKELCFFQFTPPLELAIPLAKITALRLVHSHLGKTTAMKLLRVEFTGKAGEDAVAYWVPDPARLERSIEARRGAPG